MLIIATLACICLGSVGGMAQTVPAVGPSPIATDAPAPVKTAKASIGRSALRGVTLKAATAIANLAIFYTGTGNLVGSGLLTAIDTVGVYAIYVANEYLWDNYVPNKNVSANEKKFDAAASLWRNTEKYLTFKPSAMAFKWGSIYLWTGSLSTTIALGSIGSLALPVVYFANNSAWDWYDWYQSSPESTDQHVTPPPS